MKCIILFFIASVLCQNTLSSNTAVEIPDIVFPSTTGSYNQLVKLVDNRLYAIAQNSSTNGYVLMKCSPNGVLEFDTVIFYYT